MEKQKYLLGSRVGTLESRDVQCGSIHIVYMLKRRIVIAMLERVYIKRRENVHIICLLLHNNMHKRTTLTKRPSDQLSLMPMSNAGKSFMITVYIYIILCFVCLFFDNDEL